MFHFFSRWCGFIWSKTPHSKSTKREEGLIYEPGSDRIYDVTVYRGFVIIMPNSNKYIRVITNQQVSGRRIISIKMPSRAVRFLFFFSNCDSNFQISLRKTNKKC